MLGTANQWFSDTPDLLYPFVKQWADKHPNHTRIDASSEPFVSARVEALTDTVDFLLTERDIIVDDAQAWHHAHLKKFIQKCEKSPMKINLAIVVSRDKAAKLPGVEAQGWTLKPHSLGRDTQSYCNDRNIRVDDLPEIVKYVGTDVKGFATVLAGADESLNLQMVKDNLQNSTAWGYEVVDCLVNGDTARAIEKAHQVDNGAWVTMGAIESAFSTYIKVGPMPLKQAQDFIGKHPYVAKLSWEAAQRLGRVKAAKCYAESLNTRRRLEGLSVSASDEVDILLVKLGSIISA